MPPMPKRSEQLQRSRERKGVRDPITYGQMREVDIDYFEPDTTWHPTATMLWESVLSSGQADYYQNSDLAMLYHVCEEMSEYKFSNRKSANMLHEILQTLGDLLVTEGDRRRVRLELQAPRVEEKGLAATAQDTYADFFAGVKSGI